MDSATEELYFQKLQELVQDDDKIVTVASFASSLGISIQTSQKLIGKYVEDQRKLNAKDLAITYVLTGKLKSTKGKGVCMVKEEDLEEKQSLFENDPYKLIYSVQKNNNIDFNIIALVDMFDSTKLREKALEGSIVSKNCIKRILKVRKTPSPPPSPPTIKGKSSFFESKPGKSTEITKSYEKPSSSKNEQKPKGSGSIASLFKTAAAKSNQSGEKSSTLHTKSGDFSKQAGKRKGGLAGFLTNVAIKSPKNNKSDESKTNNLDKEKNSNNKSQDSPREDEVMDDFQETICKDTVKKEETIKKPVSEKKTNKKRRRDKSQEMPSKKRKRIVERNDSDSDDLFEKDDNNEDIVEKSDDESERIPSPIKEKPLPPKNKRRKAVEKTYEDEEGFVVTKMEYVLESASEDENAAPNPPKQEKPQEKVQKPKPKGNDKKKPTKNQSTLMNFFKKV